MYKLTNYRLKLVERSGSKLEDLLTSNNPWKGNDCGRLNCLLCRTKQQTGNQKTQECTKRSVCYEIWCRECVEKEEKEIDEREDIMEDQKKVEKRKIKRYKYIGESCRSVYERALEQLL